MKLLIVRMNAFILMFCLFNVEDVRLAALPAGITAVMSEMDKEQGVFDRLSSTFASEDECVPVRVNGIGQIDVQYLGCSGEALQRDTEAFRITDNIEVPSGISRRVNFWRRVYSLWSKNQYVMHIAAYPEIVLEIHDSSRVVDLGDKTREKYMRPSLELRKREYQRILVKLASLKTIDDSQLTATERRVKSLFDHIKARDKFSVAAGGIRVQRGQREYIAKGLEVSPKYLPHVEAEFKKQGLMPELASIAFIESSFNLQALSKVGASGVYQVMPETGRDYLIVSGDIDERNDPIKASRAAAKLLAMNYRILGRWPLAITAYNHGVGGISRAMREQATSDIVELINKYDGANFGFASKNFYAGFLGLMATLKNAGRVFPDVRPVEPLSFDVARVGGMTLAEVKSRFKLNVHTIATLNPDIGRSFLRSGGVFPERYVLKIPPRNPVALPKLVSWSP